MAGDIDYMLRVAVPDMKAYDTFYKKLIDTMPLKNVTSRFSMEQDQVHYGLPARRSTSERQGRKEEGLNPPPPCECPVTRLMLNDSPGLGAGACRQGGLRSGEPPTSQERFQCPCMPSRQPASPIFGRMFRPRVAGAGGSGGRLSSDRPVRHVRSDRQPSRCAVPGEPDAFLINAYGLLYEEITASSLLKIDHGATSSPSQFRQSRLWRQSRRLRDP